MLIKNTENRFGLVAILLHWLIATLMIGMIILGLYMTGLPVGIEKLKFYGWHKEYGFVVLALAFIRLYWRLINKTPDLKIPAWEALSAQLMHWTLYGFMFALPLTGWLLTSAAGFPVSFFGLFTIPTLIAPNEELRHLFDGVHQWLAYTLIALLALHTLAAFKHHFIDKDNILKRMIFP